MTELARGANCPLTGGSVSLSVSGARPGTVDLMVFQLTASRKVRSDADFVFFNQPASPEGAVRLDSSDRVSVDLARVPADIETLAVAVALDDAVPGSLASVVGLGVAVEQPGDRIAAAALGLTTERAAVLLEVYRRNGTWKARNVSAGWDAGLPALATEHGVSVDDPAPTPAPAPAPPQGAVPAAPQGAVTSAPPAPAPTPVPAPAPAPPAAPPVSLTKITLDKNRPSVDLAKRGDGQGTMRVNLNWTMGRGGGLFGRKKGGVDLDLGCLYELADGRKGVVQALGGTFGSLSGPPWIQLDGDDRSGMQTGGENLRIDLSDVGRFRRILIFAMIYEGVPNWAAADGVVTLYPTQGPEIEVRLDSGDNRAAICAIAMIENRGQGLTVTREVQYINGSQRFLDQAYGWGMNWTPGSK